MQNFLHFYFQFFLHSYNIINNKFVECFDEQEISMHLKPNGVVRLKHNETIEMTNFSYCPYCGRKLN